MRFSALSTITLTSAIVLSSPAIVADESDSPTIASVNGEAITELDASTQRDQFIARGQQANPNMILDELISLELMRQEAVNRGLDKTPQMASEMKIMHARVLANALLNEFTKTIDTSDEALRTEYERQVAELNVQEFKARHILLEEEAKATEVIAELDAGTSTFEEAARKYSTGPSAESGGDLGWFDSEGMVPEFSEATAAMEVGKYSTKPVATEFGFHVILLEDKRAKDPQPFDSVKQQVHGMLLQSKVAEFIDGLRAAAEIEQQ